MKKLLLILLCTVFVTGCAVQKYNFDESKSGKKIVHEERQDFWIGIIPESRQILAQNYCEVEDIKQIETLLTFEGVLSNQLPYFKNVKVHCGSV